MSQNDKTRQAQVVVIGAGPGGYAAAFAAADRGLKTVLVNAEENPGGVCLLRGCIPSKALLHVAKLLHEAKEAEAWGIKFNKPEIDIGALRKFKEDVVAKNAGHNVTPLGCAPDLVASFLSDPSTPLDGSCLDDIEVPAIVQRGEIIQ